MPRDEIIKIFKSLSKEEKRVVIEWLKSNANKEAQHND